MIYIIEDDENIRNLVQVALNGSGYETAAFETAEEALGAFKVKAPQLAIFDLMLPGMDGLEAIRKIRANDAWKKLPVLVLTAKDKEYDKVAGLDGGADDYMTKPFDSGELMARVRALTRRQGEVLGDVLKVGDLSLECSSRLLRVGERSVRLGFKEFEVMRLLMVNSRAVVSKETLIAKIWGLDSEAEDNNVEVYISFLRKKLAYLGSRIAISTVRKVGYYLEHPGE